MSFVLAASLLADANTVVDRATAMSLVAESTVDLELRRFFTQKTHLAIRGGLRTLIREALAEPEGSAPRRAVERFLADEHRSDDTRDTQVRMMRIATTRAPSCDDARILTIETGAHVEHAALTQDGTRVVAYAWGESPWPCLGAESVSSFVSQWRVPTGEHVSASRIGQFREGDGTFALSPDGHRIAVRHHRSTHVHEIDPATHVVALRPCAVLSGTEGADTITFETEDHVLADDGYDLIRYDASSGETLAQVSSTGNGGRAVATARNLVLVGGGGSRPVPSIAVHARDSLALLAVAAADATSADGDVPRVPLSMPRWRDIVSPRNHANVASVALSPSQTRLASGDWVRDVRLWDVAALAECAGSSQRPARIVAPRIGSHEGWVGALAFVDDDRLLSGGWDGAVLDHDLRDRARPPRALYGHAGRLVAIDVLRDANVAVSAASDGSIVLWDLARGVSTRPPFVLDYGGHRPPIALRVTDTRVHIAVGYREVVFDHAGTVVETRACEPPDGAERSATPVVDVRGFRSNAIEVDVTSYARGDAIEGQSPDISPALVITHDGVLVDIVALESSALAFAWVHARTLVVLDGGGHVSFWKLD